jgi:hypothetical protein
VNGLAAYQIGKVYLTSSVIRQDFLEKAIEWLSEGNIEKYMGSQWQRFVALFSVGNKLGKSTFPKIPKGNERR